MSIGSWAFTVQVGWADEAEKYVARVLDEDRHVVHVETADTLGRALGLAAAAVMEVTETEA